MVFSEGKSNKNMEVQFANAPCSWGVLEFEGVEKPIEHGQMLDELKLAGYKGTELGDYGFMPTEGVKCRHEVKTRDLDLIGAFCTYALYDPSKYEEGRNYARRVASILTSFGDQKFRPHIVLADNVSCDMRIRNAGKITPEMSLDKEKWQLLVEEVIYLRDMIRKEYGVDVYFHPHCGSYIEAPWEIEGLIADVPGIQLVFDTGHVAMGARGDANYVLEVLEKYPDSVRTFHFKDFDKNIAGEDYFDLVSKGVFCELGAGSIDFAAVKKWQETNGYKGWVVVEQDVLRSMGSPLQAAVRNMAFLQDLYGLSAMPSKL